MPAGTIKHWYRPAFLNIERPRLYQGLMIIILQEFLNVGYLIQNFSAQPDIRNTPLVPIILQASAADS